MGAKKRKEELKRVSHRSLHIKKSGSPLNPTGNP